METNRNHREAQIGQSHCRGFGFAAGCAAVATPRRQAVKLFGATPLVRVHPFQNLLSQKAVSKGHSPELKSTSTAGHSHRRTSGGKADPEVAHNISGKLSH